MALAERLGIGGRVEFAGYVSKVESGLGDCDLFALITNWEGFPRSILEAMRAGLPVVASDVGGCRESVIDGDNGRVVPRGDLPALTAALQQILANPALRLRMGRRGYQLYCESFSFETMYQTYLRLYATLIPTRDVEQVVICPAAPTFDR